MLLRALELGDEAPSLRGYPTRALSRNLGHRIVTPEVGIERVTLARTEVAEARGLQGGFAIDRVMVKKLKPVPAVRVIGRV